MPSRPIIKAVFFSRLLSNVAYSQISSMDARVSKLVINRPAELESIHLQIPELGSAAAHFKGVADAVFRTNESNGGGGPVLALRAPDAIGLLSAKPGITGWGIGWVPTGDRAQSEGVANASVPHMFFGTMGQYLAEGDASQDYRASLAFLRDIFEQVREIRRKRTP